MFGRWTKGSSLAPSASLQPGRRMKWYRAPPKHVDTVVFVHGILGDYITTWGQFPKLLAEDDDLPELDILLWGYRTGIFARNHELHLEGGHLATTLESLIQPPSDIVLVGHSMGGLIILKALVDRMKGGFAQMPPCQLVVWISLFATPLSGTWLAGLANALVAMPIRKISSLYKHLLALSRGSFVDELMEEVHPHIYNPNADSPRHRKIPIRIIAASRDSAVDKTDRDFALARYTNPPALQLDETHGSVKLPPHAGDLRYKVLVRDLHQGFARTFRALSEAAFSGASEQERSAALYEMRKRYGRIIRRRLRDRVRRIDLHQGAENDALLLLATYGTTHDLPPFVLVDYAIEQLAVRRPEWR
jgi:pimeloyl-ACP methyl ester carboxylesterase